MRSLQDYINIYSTIASNSNLQGDSVDMLVQMLAHASYISEVENVSYVQESSLEKAKLVNSKIQRCMDEMYSVFRGRCPRVIMNIRPKTYFTFNPFDEIIKSNNFKVYYLGYYSGKTETDAGTDQVSILEGFKYGPITLSPEEGTGTYQILGLIAAETSSVAWQATKLKNYYFENLAENLSNDMWVVKNGQTLADVTTSFSDHIQERKIYDLTLPSFGSRLYVANVFNEGGLTENTVLQANYYKYCTLSDFPSAELRKISLKGSDLVEFLTQTDWDKEEARKKANDPTYPPKVYPYNFLSETSYQTYDQNYKNYSAPGLIFIDSENRDSLGTIHYKASRDRYVNSLLRSNSDIGALLENMFPDKVSSGGTNYKYLATGDIGDLTVYYAPKSTLNLLTSNEIEEYKNRVTFYINNKISVEKGKACTAVFNIDLELYQAVDVTDKVMAILDSYEHKFGIFLDQKKEEIKSLISKISNVSNVKDFGVDYLDESGIQLSEKEILTLWEDVESTYFNIEANINSIVRTRSVDDNKDNNN